MDIFGRTGISALVRFRGSRAGTADAEQPRTRRLTVVNHGKDAVVAVHARPFGSDCWGADLLDGRPIAAGDVADLVTRQRATARRWDVWIQYSCGAGHCLRGTDLTVGRQIGVTEFGVRTF